MTDQVINWRSGADSQSIRTGAVGGRLFHRDFSGDLIEDYGLKLTDYGFFKRDDWPPQDDMT